MAGAALSGAVAPPQLLVASATAFLLSELADFAVYTPLQSRGLVLAVLASSVVGLVADSILFLWLAFGSLDYLAGQILGKLWMVLLALPFIHWIRKRELGSATRVVDMSLSLLPVDDRVSVSGQLKPERHEGAGRRGLRRRGEQPARRRGVLRPAARRPTCVRPPKQPD